MLKYLQVEVGIATAHDNVGRIRPLIATTTLGIRVGIHLSAAALGHGRVVILGVCGVVHALCQRRQQVDNSGGPVSYSCAHWPICVCRVRPANALMGSRVLVLRKRSGGNDHVTAGVHAFVLARVCVRSYLCHCMLFFSHIFHV